MTGAAAAVALALGSLGTGALLVGAWALTSAARESFDVRGAVAAFVLTALVLVAEPTLAAPVLGALFGFGVGLGTGLGCMRLEREAWLGITIVLGCAAVVLVGEPGPVHGDGPLAWVELWLRAPGTPLAIGAGVVVVLAGRLPGIALGGLALLLFSLWSEGRPRIAEAGATAALLAGAAVAWLPRARLPLVWILVGVQLLVAALGWIPAVDPYDHPPDLPRRRGAVLDVRVGGAALVSGLAVAPDGRVFYGEMATGVVRELDPGGEGPGQILARVTLPKIHGARRSYELGLWGLAVHPRVHWLYAMAVHRWDESSPDPLDRSSRVVRIGLQGEQRGRLEDVVTGLPAGPIHSGGVLAFGPDGQLYVTVGDGLLYGPRGSVAVEPGPGPATLSGAVLRYTADGRPSEGNPSAGSPVYAWGFRNPYGLTFDADGALFVTENGADCCDRLLRVQPGAHHGWPPTEASAVDPLWDSARHRPGVTGLAVLGEHYGEYAGDLVFSTWHSGALHRVGLGGGVVMEHEVVLDVPPAHPESSAPYRFAGAFTALATGPDGVVWFSTVNAVGRITALAPR